MPWQPWEETIDQNTPDDMLHRIVQAAEGYHDTNYVRVAGAAKAELTRREQKQRMDELVVQLNAQREMTEKLIQSTRELSGQQAKDADKLANKQMTISKSAALAAWGQQSPLS